MLFIKQQQENDLFVVVFLEKRLIYQKNFFYLLIYKLPAVLPG
jgi:hypothetical protein